jgi:hypothetical protein
VYIVGEDARHRVRLMRVPALRRKIGNGWCAAKVRFVRAEIRRDRG